MAQVTKDDRKAARALCDYAGFSFAADHLDMALDATAEAIARHREQSQAELLEALEIAVAYLSELPHDPAMKIAAAITKARGDAS